jgi:hypothetical protein
MDFTPLSSFGNLLGAAEAFIEILYKDFILFHRRGSLNDNLKL